MAIVLKLLSLLLFAARTLQQSGQEMKPPPYSPGQGLESCAFFPPDQGARGRTSSLLPDQGTLGLLSFKLCPAAGRALHLL